MFRGRLHIMTVFCGFFYHDFLTLLHFFSFLFLYRSVCSTLFFSKHLLQASQNNSSVIQADLKNHNVFCKTIKCKVNWYKVASVKYNYFWMITSKNYLKRKVHIFLKINCFNFLLRWFLSQSLCLSLYRFPNEKLCFRPQLVLKNLVTVLS